MSRISATQHNEKATAPSWQQIYLGVAFTTMATLLLELAMTRIFSVVFYYHFAFLAISIALFGLGAGGVFSYVVAGWRGNLYSKLGALSLANALIPLCSLLFVLTRSGEFSNWTLTGVYFFSALPFFVAGAIVSLVISETIERVQTVYFFDLLGAACGCLLLLPFLTLLGGPNTVIASGVLFAVAASFWYNLSRWRVMRAGAVLIALWLTALIVYNMKRPVIDVKFAKGQELKGEEYIKWNGISRIAVSKDQGGGLQIVIDADASTGIFQWDLEHLNDAQRKDLTEQGPGFPYAVRPGAKALIIGPGGGWDVARALAYGSKDITGVEINHIIATDVMRGKYASLSRNLYTRPEVHIQEEDGRSFIRRSTEKYQVIQATLVDTWASTAAGAFALSESNLYTSDAFYDYLSHLTDDGLMAFTRWGFEPPRESLRLLILARTALEALGETEYAKHVMVVREGSLKGWGARDTVLVSRKPFTDADVQKARADAAKFNLEIVYMPGDGGSKNAFGKVLVEPNIAPFLARYPYDISSVDDNRPFFFYTVQPQDIYNFARTAATDNADYKINRAVPMLFGVMGISLFATVVTLLMPPMLLGTSLPRERGVKTFLFYFLCIGVGYILIQVSLIQKFVLFLGHPTHALTVIIFSMLVASGCGSFFSKRIIGEDNKRWTQVLIAVAIIVGILAFLSAPVTKALVGLPLPLKMLVTVCMIFPAGFVMGMPFPTGLGRLEQFHKPSVRWAWSLNAASSVLGSAGSIFCAIYLGLRETMLLGGLLYIAAMFIVKVAMKKRTSEA